MLSFKNREIAFYGSISAVFYIILIFIYNLYANNSGVLYGNFEFIYFFLSILFFVFTFIGISTQAKILGFGRMKRIAYIYAILFILDSSIDYYLALPFNQVHEISFDYIYLASPFFFSIVGIWLFSSILLSKRFIRYYIHVGLFGILFNLFYLFSSLLSLFLQISLMDVIVEYINILNTSAIFLLVVTFYYISLMLENFSYDDSIK